MEKERPTNEEILKRMQETFRKIYEVSEANRDPKTGMTPIEEARKRASEIPPESD